MSSSKYKEEDFLSFVKTFTPEPDEVLEYSILASIVNDPDTNYVFSIVTPEMFLNTGARAAYKAMSNLYKTTGKVEYDGLEAELREEKDHFFILTSIGRFVGSSPHFEFLIKVLKYRYLKMWFLILVSSFPHIMKSDMAYEDLLEKFEDSFDVLKPLIAESKYNSFYEELREKKESGFMPHKVRRGEEEYKIYQSKFNPEKGYTYIDNVAVQEEKLLEMGFEQVYD